MPAAIKAPNTEQSDVSREVGTIWSVKTADFFAL